MKRTLITTFLIILSIAASAQRFAPEWLYEVKGSGQDFAREVILDDSGNRYLIGTFSNTVDFDPSPDVFDLTSSGNFDVFLSKFDSLGKFLWARRIGGGSDDRVTGICMDKAGNIYLTGYYRGTCNFDPGRSNLGFTSKGLQDFYVVKFRPDGQFLWARSIGGSLNDEALKIVCNSKNELIIGGSFAGLVDFDPGAGVAEFNTGSIRNAFYMKMDSAGKFIWNKVLESPKKENFVIDIALDRSDNLYISGWFADSTDFHAETPNLAIRGAEGFFDGYLLKTDADGKYQWVRTFGGGGYVRQRFIHLDINNNIYLSGSFSDSMDFDPGPIRKIRISKGKEDGYIIKLNSMGQYRWSHILSGPENQVVFYNGSDENGALYVSGFYSDETNFGTDANPVIRKSFKARGGFYAKYSSAGVFQWVNTFENLSDGSDIGPQGMMVAGSDHLYLWGFYSGASYFEFGAADSFKLNSSGMADAFFTEIKSCANLSNPPAMRPQRCFRDTLPSGKVVYGSGFYLDTAKNSRGCDSIIYVVTQISAPDTAVSIAGGQLTSNHSDRPMWSPRYEWLDCDDNFRTAGSGKVFNAPKNGNYALKISDGEYCNGYVTQCFNITQVGLTRTLVTNIKLWPNPGSGVYFIDFGNFKASEAIITDLNGKIISHWTEIPSLSMTFKLEAPAGIYFLSLKNENAEFHFKLIHQP